ncbi:MAG: bifunctional oligoribonuclease/PAP phosphatase NrnA [Bacteroidetes bacterium]|nr:MAG: bifunctional oligoribonuclease/PAP phosphatase NrnA [Bacteroidota bacterium]
MLTNQQKDELADFFSKKKKIALTTHINPDGDAMGSTIAMMHYLRAKGHDVTAIVPNKYPEFYGWIPGTSDLVIFEKNATTVKKVLAEADMIFSLDYNSIKRVGPMSNLLKVASGKKFLIDHHIDPEEGFDYYHHTTETTSTGQLVFRFIELMGDKALLSKEIAVALYVAIMTDTGSFSYAANYPETYHIVAELIEKGVDAEQVHRLVYDTFSENRLRLLGYAISERMLVWPHLHTAVIYLTKEDLKRFNYQVGDTEGVVNYPLSMDNVNLAVLITEKEKKIKLSFRSKGDFNVNLLSRNNFNGGGHKNAAGGQIYSDIPKTIETIKATLEPLKETLNYKLSY